MCYNCGCQIPQDDMGSPLNITESTFVKMAQDKGIDSKKIKDQILQFLESRNSHNQEFEDLFIAAANAWGQSIEEAKKETLNLLKTTVNK